MTAATYPRRENRQGAGRAWKAPRAAKSCLGIETSSLRSLSPKKERALFAAFPTTFAARQLPCSALGKGMSVGDGWFDIVWRLAAALEGELRARLAELDACSEDGPGTSITEVRERAGVLVVRIDPASGMTPSIRAAIGAAVRASRSTCERCGMPGKSRKTLAGRQTLCSAHQCGDRMS